MSLTGDQTEFWPCLGSLQWRSWLFGRPWSVQRFWGKQAIPRHSVTTHSYGTRSIIDRQKDNYQRFLTEAMRLSELSSAPSFDGEFHADVLGKLPNKGPLMNDDISAVIKGVARSLRQPDREVELTVWCSHSLVVPWARAARQANQLRDETIQLLKLPSDQQTKLTAVARPWPWNSTKTNTDGLTDEQNSNVRKHTLRPAMSVPVHVTSFPEVL
jgi:hypothetical protein